jgi:RNA polymerase sigma-70 factor (ECF subfamily)
MLEIYERDTTSYEEVREGEDAMSPSMILPTLAKPEEFTERVFSDLLRSFQQKQGDVSEAVERSKHRPQKATPETVRQMRSESEPIMAESASQHSIDVSLVDLAAAGNERAFELLVERYETLVWHFVYHHLACTEDVQDVVQFVFLQLYLFLPKLQGHLISTRSQRPLKSWLFQVARNRCVDERRKLYPCLFSDLETATEEESSPFEALPDMAPLPEETVEQLDLQHLLQEAIQALPSLYRPIVSLRYREELTFREIGQRLRIPANTAKTYFQRARPLLRAALASLEAEGFRMELRVAHPSTTTKRGSEH